MSVGGFQRTRDRGVERTGFLGFLAATAYDLICLTNRLARPPFSAIF